MTRARQPHAGASPKQRRFSASAIPAALKRHLTASYPVRAGQSRTEKTSRQAIPPHVCCRKPRLAGQGTGYHARRFIGDGTHSNNARHSYVLPQRQLWAPTLPGRKFPSCWGQMWAGDGSRKGHRQSSGSVSLIDRPQDVVGLGWASAPKLPVIKDFGKSCVGASIERGHRHHWCRGFPAKISSRSRLRWLVDTTRLMARIHPHRTPTSW